MTVGFKCLLVSVSFCLILGGCGGDDDNSTSALKVDCAGANCGAVNNNTYGGEGIGVWRYVNNSSSREANVPVNLSGVGGKTVTLIYTNLSENAVLMPDVPISDSLTDTVALKRQKAVSTERAMWKNRVPPRVRNFDSRPYLEAGKAATIKKRRSKATKKTASLYDRRTWYVIDVDNNVQQKQATLRRKVTAADGRGVNIWVEDNQYGQDKFSDTLVQTFAQYFATGANAIYKLDTDIAGAPWGAHQNVQLIDPSQDIDIVFAGDMGSGTLGYFWAVNNFYRDPYDVDLQYSNESLSLYINAEAAYQNDSIELQISTMAHELLHMIHFYQRTVLMGPEYAFDTFLEEAVAEMMEDVVDYRAGLSFSEIRDVRFLDWVSVPSFNCNFTDWGGQAECESYSVSASFGAYLLRHYGIDFYKDLLRSQSSTDSLKILDDTIRKHSSSDYLESLRRWGTMIALLPADSSPKWFGYPKRVDQGYTLSAINGPDYKDLIRLPITLPKYLHGYAFFPLTRYPVGKTYSETIPVPPNTALTVVVN